LRTNKKTGSTLAAAITPDHFRASGTVEVDLKESSRMAARLTTKGLRILDVRLAIRCLIPVCVVWFCCGQIPEL
jgi:hypothetical protein